VLAPLPDLDGRWFSLRAGGARFSVPHDARRPFVVLAGDVTIEDLGTTFTVRYAAADRLNIAVEEGRVRVRAGSSDTEVPAGATLEVPVSPLAEAAPKQQRRTGVVASSWRPLAERGQYDEAQKALRKAGPSAVRDDTADLLLAADAARLSGHPAEAVPYLERVVRGHSHDPRAGLAAFTLGRVLLDELGRPGEAVDAFAFVRSSGGPLAEDALARQVEAVSRAGDVTRSRELALLYRRLYPNGRRTKAVSRFGGLD
jgi:transmembrane sensor